MNIKNEQKPIDDYKNLEKPNILEPIRGFGDHNSPIEYKNYQQAKRIAEIALAVLGVSLLGGGLVVLSIFVPIIPIALAASSVIIFTTSSAVISSASIATIISIIHLNRQGSAFFGVMNKINDKIFSPPVKLGEYSTCKTIACQDTTESFHWKKKLIESAEHSIVLSGNYCGGNSFDEILDLIKKQLAEKPNLKIVIISSDKFINPSNKERINQLQQEWEHRFQLVESPDIWHINPGLKKTTNHSKFLVIDYGSHFLLGGSGIEDKYAYAKGLGDRGAKQQAETGGLLGLFLPRGFRDQDFVFSSSSQQGVGRRVYIEALKLALRWEGINRSQYLPVDTEEGYTVAQLDTVVKSLLVEETLPSVESRSINTTIEEFDNDPHLVSNAQTKVLCMGPEHVKNPFAQELFDRIQDAKERIVIDHMYFHPTEKILNALVDAAKRGVKIKIVTNGVNKASPRGHQAFAPRNHYNYYVLAKRIGPTYKNNLEVYEFKVPKTTLHKKVIVIDDYVIAGSSNLGYKSLVTMSDHEINFITKSKDLADETAHIIDIDTLHKEETSAPIDESSPSDLDDHNDTQPIAENKHIYAKLITNPEKRPGIKHIIKAAMHRINAPLIG